MGVGDSVVEIGEDGRWEEGGEDGESPVESNGPVARAGVEVRFRVVDEDSEAVL